MTHVEQQFSAQQEAYRENSMFAGVISDALNAMPSLAQPGINRFKIGRVHADNLLRDVGWQYGYNGRYTNSDAAMFENPEIPIDQLPKVDTVTWLRMDKKYARRKLVDAVITFVMLMVGVAIMQTILRVATNGADLPQIISWLWWLPILVAIPLFSWPFISVPRKGYVVRDKDIIYKSGVFWHTITAIPFNRIQHVEKSSTPLDRRFQLASLQLFTAGGSGGDLKIHGLAANTAEKLRKYILDKVGTSLARE